MIGKLYEFGMRSSDIAELGCTELWKVGLYVLASFNASQKHNKALLHAHQIS